MSGTMEYKGYHAKPEYSAEDNLFIGEIVGIKDSISFHGKSIKEIEDSFREAVDDYLDLCKQIGKTPEKEYSGQFIMRVPADTHRDLVIAATSQGISLNRMVLLACDNYLNSIVKPVKNT